MDKIPDYLMVSFIAIAAGAIAGAFIIGYFLGRLGDKMKFEIAKFRHEVHLRLEKIEKYTHNMPVRGKGGLYESRKTFRNEAAAGSPRVDPQKG